MTTATRRLSPLLFAVLALLLTSLPTAAQGDTPTGTIAIRGSLCANAAAAAAPSTVPPPTPSAV